VSAELPLTFLGDNNLQALDEEINYIKDALAAGELSWWEPYAEIHARNIDSIKNLRRR
jgi:hypothetical protein